MPPLPVKSPEKKPIIKVDTTKIHTGTPVKHKAFGNGKVKSIEGTTIFVDFNGADKKFQFPGAFEQGFLKLEE